MGLLNPAGIAWLVSVPALIWIYRRSRKKRRIEISSIIPWRVLKESVVRSSLFRADLLFWVQLAILLSLAAAACRPYWRGAAGPGRRRHFVMVMDRSASMQTIEGSRRRWDLALDRAAIVARRLGERDRATLIAAGVKPEVLASGETSAGRIEAILRGIGPADTPDAMAPALGMGMALLREGERRRRAPGGAKEETYLHIFTDRSPESLGLGREGAGGAIRVERVGSPKGNAAITSLAVYTDLFSPRQTASAYVTVENLSAERYAGTLAARAGGKEISSMPVVLPPGGSFTTPVGEALPEGAVEVVLDPPDALPADNRAWAVMTGRRTERIVLFTRDTACAKAFKELAAAIPHLELAILGPEKYASTDMARFHTAVFHRCEPARPPAANLLLICPPSRSALVPVKGEWATGLEFLNWDEGHPVGENLRGLNNVSPGGARVLSIPPWASPVVISATREGDIPLVLCGRLNGRKVVVMGYDAAAIDYRKPESLPALVLLLNTFKWLGTDERSQVKTGEAYETLLPGEGVADGEGASYKVIDPRGREHAVSAAPGEPLVFGETEYAGLYLLAGGGVSRSFAANLLSRAESDLGGGDETGDRAAVEEVASVSVPPPPPPDRGAIFLLAAAALMLADWFFYSAGRRATAPPVPQESEQG